MPPLLLGTSLLNDVERFDPAQLQQRLDCRVHWVVCQYFPLAKLYRCYGTTELYRRYGAAETLPVLRCALQTVQRLEYVCPANVDAQLPSAVAGVESCLRKANTTTVRHATLLDALGTSLAWQPALRAAAESDAGLNGWIEHFFEAAAAADATFSDPMSVTQLMTAQVRLSAALVASDVGHAAHDGSYAPQRNVACIRCRSRSS